MGRKRGGGKVAKVMREAKRGTLRSSSGARVKSRKQALAIGLNEARRAGESVAPPPNKGGTPKKRRRPRMGSDHAKNASRMEAFAGDTEF